MGKLKPFKRTYRHSKNSITTGYIFDSMYASNASQYIRSYLLIQNDYLKILEFVEPCDNNLKTYSMRIQELLFRTCVEVEANFTAILKENNYKHKGKNLNISDFILVNKSHYLSDYQVKFSFWQTKDKIFIPFKEFEDLGILSWYRAYNKSKHNKYIRFQEANFESLTNAVMGLLVLVTSQFFLFDLNKSSHIWTTPNFDSFNPSLGDLFGIKYPTWGDDEMYDFNWEDLKLQNDRFELFNYHPIK